MSLFSESNISELFVGENKIDKIFVGENLVYQSTKAELDCFYFKIDDPTTTADVGFERFITENIDYPADTSQFVNYVAPTFEYSRDKKNWSTYTLGTAITIGSGYSDRVYFRGDNLERWHDYYSTGTSGDKTNPARSYTTYIKAFINNNNCGTYGNIMALRYKTPINSKRIPCVNAFTYIFVNCTLLTSAPELPATTLADSCYSNMFQGCTSLTSTPKLPATTLANGCYFSMFYRCASLTSAPELPATTLANNCYNMMFDGCTSLTSAPELPATTLAIGCYNLMFQGCTSLTSTPKLPATTLATSCYYGMFAGCTSLIQISKLPALTIPDGGILGTYASMFNHSSVRANATSSGVCIHLYRIPTSDTGTSGSKDLNSMFMNLDGTRSFTPSINTEFYISVPSF